MVDGKSFRYVIAGAGAIGGTLAALLSRAGSKTICISRPALVRVMNTGLTVRLEEETIQVKVDAVTDASDISPRDEDLLVLTAKSQSTATLVDALRQRYNSKTPIVCLQNGVSNEVTAAGSFERVYAGLVFFSATQLRPDEVLVPPGRRIAIGVYPEGVDQAVEQMSEDFRRAGFDAVASPYTMAMKYGKLVANLNNATHAITGLWLELGAVDDDMRRLMVAVREEGLRVLEAAGIAVEPPPGEPASIRILEMTRKMKQPADPEARRRALELPESDRTYASTWQDLYLGRRESEADHLNGEIVRLGKKYGVPTPYNSALLELIDRMFREGQKPGILSPGGLQKLIESGGITGNF
ncbi:MAG TPA: ketopantoate reductase family protein [Blastocatellia bacterium]|nr:ketopantoate reductase family protein [Blastocatellia bacterium]